MMDQVIEYINNNWRRYLEEVRDFLKMPSISATGEGIQETANFLKNWLEDRLSAEVILLSYGGHPIVYGYMDNGAKESLVFYNMYDVQPVEPLEEWVSPPFDAKIIDGKIIARGAINTKAPLMASLLGLEALKRTSRLPVNIFFVFEGEEELGSPSMPKFVDDKGFELKNSSGVVFVIPSEMPKGKPRIILGVKGIIYLELEVKTCRYDVHSSLVQAHYNPIEILSSLIATLKDKDGNILVDWLYEDVTTPLPEDFKYLKDILEAFSMEEIAKLHGIKKMRKRGKELVIELFFKPSINIDGIIGGHVGKGTKTITPAKASLKMDIRLVPNMVPEKTLKKFLEHLEKYGFKKWIKVKIHDMYDWSRTSPDSKIVKVALKTYQDLNIKPYVFTTTTGSAPFYLFTKKLNLPVISSGPAYGGRAHAPNEFIEVEGIKNLIQYTSSLIANWNKI